WHIKRNGERFWASGEMMALRREGQILGFSKILRDRTAERLTSERLRLAQQVSGAGILEIPDVGDELALSAEFAKLWGLPPIERIDRRTLLAIVHPDDREQVDRILFDSATRREELVDFRILRRDSGD